MMQNNRHPKTWMFATFVSLVSTILLLFAIGKYILPEALDGDPTMWIFLAMIVSLLIINLVNYLRYYVFKIGVELPDVVLEDGEAIWRESNEREIASYIKGFKGGIARIFCVITNRRVILAGNLFGVWTYRYMASSFWYNDARPGVNSLQVNEISLSDDRAAIRLHTKYRDFEVAVDDAEELCERMKGVRDGR